MSIERMSSNDSVEAGVRVTPTVVENDYLAMLFLHSTAGDTSAAAQKLSEVAGQYTDARLTMKGQDAGRRSMDLAGMLGMGRQLRFEVQAQHGWTDDYLKAENKHDALDGMDRPDTALLRSMSGDLSAAAPLLQEVSELLASGSEPAIKMVARIAALQLVLNDPGATQAEVEAHLEVLSQLVEKSPEILAKHKNLMKWVQSLTNQALERFPSAKIEALVTAIVKPRSPEQLLSQSVEATIESLRAVAQDESLSDELRAEAEEMIAELEALADGEVLSIEMFQKLEALGKRLEGTSHAPIVRQSVTNLRSANIVLKAYSSGLTVAQIHQVETSMAELGALAVAMKQQGGLDLSEAKPVIRQLERTVQALDQNPLSVTAYAASTVVAQVLQSPAAQSLAVGSSSVAPAAIAAKVEAITVMQEPIITRAPVGSPQAQTMKANLGVGETTQALKAKVEALVSKPAPANIVTPNGVEAVIPQAAAQTGVPQSGPEVVSTFNDIGAQADPNAQVEQFALEGGEAVATPVVPDAPILGAEPNTVSAVDNTQGGVPSPPPLESIPSNDFSDIAPAENTQRAQQAIDSVTNKERVRDLKAEFTAASSPQEAARILYNYTKQSVMETVKGCGACVTGACAGCKITFNKAMMNVGKALVSSAQVTYNKIINYAPK